MIQDRQKNTGGKNPAGKIKMTGSAVAAAVAVIALIVLFGAFGGLICCGGYFAVRTVLSSRLPLPAKALCAVLLTAVFLALLGGYLYLSVLLQMQMEA